jgi:hypothetical protein
MTLYFAGIESFRKVMFVTGTVQLVMVIGLALIVMLSPIFSGSFSLQQLSQEMSDFLLRHVRWDQIYILTICFTYFFCWVYELRRAVYKQKEPKDFSATTAEQLKSKES